MKRSRPFIVSAPHRAGVLRAAQWHDKMARIFRNAVEDRKKYQLQFGEMVSKMEEHESNAQQLRELALTPQQRARNAKRAKKMIAEFNKQFEQ